MSSSYCLELSFWQEICVCDWAGFSFQIKFLYRDKADYDIQWKHVRQIALPRVTQVRLFKLNCIHMLAGRSYRKNYDFLNIFIFFRRCDTRAIMLWDTERATKLSCTVIFTLCSTCSSSCPIAKSLYIISRCCWFMNVEILLWKLVKSLIFSIFLASEFEN